MTCEDYMQLAESVFRMAARRYASGVTVVTTTDGRVMDGVTVSSFTTLSMCPLLVLVAVGGKGLFLHLLRTWEIFAVNILGSDQEQVARYFSDPRRPRTVAAFPGIETCRGVTGAPILGGCLGHFDCVVDDIQPYGDHELIVGKVRDASHSHGSPLVYYDGAYRSIAAELS